MTETHAAHELATDLLARDARLAAVYQPERVDLFGSVARGQTGPESDYDLLLVVPDEASPQRQDGRRAYRALQGTGIAADVIVWRRSAFERRKRSLPHCPARCCARGTRCMAHDPERVAKTRAWLARTTLDLDAACPHPWPLSRKRERGGQQPGGGSAAALAVARAVYAAIRARLPRRRAHDRVPRPLRDDQPFLYRFTASP